MSRFAALITKHKAAKHQIPPNQGWRTRAQVAREIGVNIRDVREHLSDAIAAKEIEEKKFTEWDAAAMKALPVTCYRIVEKPEPKSPCNAKIIITKPGKPSKELTAAIQAAAERHPHLSASRLREYIPKRLRHACTTEQVAAILERE